MNSPTNTKNSARAIKRPLGDLAAPRRRHRRITDRLLAWLAVDARRLERIEQGGTQLLGLVVGQGFRADLHRRRPTAADRHHLLRVLAQCLAEDVFDLLDGGFSAWEGHRGAALEVDAEGEAADRDGPDRDRDDQGGDDEPNLPASDDVERTRAGVEPCEEAVPRQRRGRRFDARCLDGAGLRRARVA